MARQKRPAVLPTECTRKKCTDPRHLAAVAAEDRYYEKFIASAFGADFGDPDQEEKDAASAVLDGCIRWRQP